MLSVRAFMCMRDINAFNRNTYAYEYFWKDFKSKQTTKRTDTTELSCWKLSVHNGNGANELVKLLLAYKQKLQLQNQM